MINNICPCGNELTTGDIEGLCYRCRQKCNTDVFNNVCVPQGWQCPICQRVYSPTTIMCFYCGMETKVTAVDTTSAGIK